MFQRPFWINRIEEAWRQVPIAWLCGVRRCGKTTLAESLDTDRVTYVNCDLPKSEEMVREPVVFYKSGNPLRQEDLGALWEHLVLEHLQAHFPDTTIRYWRDKAGREVDFVLAHRRDEVDTIECKWDSRSFDSTALQIFRSYYPKGRNFVVTPSSEPGYLRVFGDLEVRVCTPSELHP